MVQPRLFGLGILLCVGGCAGLSQQQCLKRDWYHNGMADALDGRSTNQLDDYEKQCLKHGIKPDRQRYREGYADGRRDYCTAGNGYRLGLHDMPPRTEWCSNDDFTPFRESFESGQKKYQQIRRQQAQEAQRRHIEQRIRTIEIELMNKDLSDGRKQALESERRRLETQQIIDRVLPEGGVRFTW
ncbi:DUF2799 domain-containing protein [Chitinivorax sp. B]|uniref:DUF2799 domain-containing protein n=1 Tax=Chitinivorax sp. B TaxID=2502235 RepID=UPI0010F941BB|nr:DUF2799 domain-containing protein [Chitinivorax sp. B]